MEHPSQKTGCRFCGILFFSDPEGAHPGRNCCTDFVKQMPMDSPVLTLLSRGIENMYLGPALPPFMSETVVMVRVDTYGLQPVTAPEQDPDAILHRG